MITYDVIIIGGSYAGLSAAMTLGRSLRSTLVIDSGAPCNRQTPRAHNLITHDGTPPAEILAQARRQVTEYESVECVDSRAIQARQLGQGFEVTLDSGKRYQGKKLIMATGIRDILPAIEGLAACWGISAIHCPYCHGYEFKEQETGILVRTERAVHLLGLIRNLSHEVRVFYPSDLVLDEEAQKKLLAEGVVHIQGDIIEILHKDGYMQAVRLDNGREVPLQALYIDAPFEQHSSIAADIGCKMTEAGHIEVDSCQKTNIPGLYACGDNASGMRSLAAAIYTGNLTGAMINMELSAE